MHVVLYDSHCPLCQNSVQFLLKIDKRKLLSFSSLTGKTAEIFFKKNKKDLTSLIFIESYGMENERIWRRGKGVFRILFLLGGKWKWLGMFYWVPGIDYFYSLIASHRHLLSSEKSVDVSIPPERNLP